MIVEPFLGINTLRMAAQHKERNNKQVDNQTEILCKEQKPVTLPFIVELCIEMIIDT